MISRKTAKDPSSAASSLSTTGAAAMTPRRAPSAEFAQNVYDALPRAYAPQNDSAHRALDSRIRAIGQAFNGDIGIAERDVETGWTTAYDGDTFFPQQSVSKFWVALTALDKVDRGELSLSRAVTLHKGDIPLFHQPIAGATPLGVGDALARLKRGELLSPESTQRLLSIMSHTKTGPQRLKGGLEPGWHLSHKTGTGQVLGSVQAGYNDIGVITAPDGHSYALAVMIRRTSAPLGERMRAMQNTVRAVIGFHSALEDQGEIAGYRGGRRTGARR